jgi:TPR repeat protein
VPPNPGDKLVSDGEKYLYGTGVPQNCDRARKNLLAATRQQNPKAYTLLGAMYATGHCVTRDLPSAYRWFARALHQDPGNTRLQQNLEVIWKQMTPEERKAATGGE